jgi:sphingolipid 8-(E)-desaturase
MKKYRIGRIEGPWKNFVPPIQGGVFKSLSEPADEEETDDDNVKGTEPSSTSSSSSRESSPLFDTADGTSGARFRPGDFPRSASASSTTSVEDADFDGMAHLDAITKKQISLDLNKYPSLDNATQEAIVEKYRRLDERIWAEGLYNTPYLAYLSDIGRFGFLLMLMLACLHQGWYAASGLFLGVGWHQLVFAAHDAGHNGITHNFQLDSVIGIIIADFLGGLSIGWWKRNHNVHHIVTNAPEHDPDIQHMPLFAVSHRFLYGLRSTYYERIMQVDAVAKLLLSAQSYLYYPTLALGRFNLYRLSWDHLIMHRGPRSGPAWWHWYLEIAGNLFFWAWFGYAIVYKSIPTAWDRFVFVMISHIVTCPLHVQITVSHFAMSTADLGPHESFPQRMLRTTMDVDCPPWLDFLHGGLQFQAVHHLFPRVPRYNLRKVRNYVQEFCNEVGVPYALYGFVDGNKKVVGQLAEVSRQAAILDKCRRTISENGGLLHDHHR